MLEVSTYGSRIRMSTQNPFPMSQENHPLIISHHMELWARAECMGGGQDDANQASGAGKGNKDPELK